MTEFPIISDYEKIKDVFSVVIDADMPQHITPDFVQNKLGLQDSAPLVAFMEKLGLISADGSPTKLYRDIKSETTRGAALAAAIKSSYSELYKASQCVYYSEAYNPNECPHTSDKESLEELFTRVTGKKDDVRAYVGTFQTLCHFADFNN